MESDTLFFYVNGKKVEDKNPDPEITLLSYIRNKLRLTGSKLGCGEGGCGACTVMVSKWDRRRNGARHFAVNACLAPVVSVHQCAVTTVEGIGSTKTKLHQVQERLARFHGSQCGFCTPGIVMSMYALLRNKVVPTADDIDTCLQGNLCRCTGYRPIISAFQTFTCGMGDKCCKLVKTEDAGNDMIDAETGKWKPYDASQEPIFPPELTELGKKESPHRTLVFVGESVAWHQPSNLKDLLSLKTLHPDAKIVAGNSEVGIEMNIKGMRYKHLISPEKVSELHEIKETAEDVSIGAACKLTDVEIALKKICEKKSPIETQILTAVLEMLHLFAGVQVRNVACIGGNIMTASPISDLNPIFLACGVRLKFASKSSEREIVMDQNFFTGYRRTNTKPEEVLLSLTIPFLSENDVMAAYKQSKRKDDDIAIVNAAMHVNFDPGTTNISKLSIALGGMDAVTKMALQTMKKAVGRSWDLQFLEDACRWLSEEMELRLDAPGGMVQYRRTLVMSFLFKFYHHTFAKLVERGVTEENNVKLSRSITKHLAVEDMEFSSTRTWQDVSNEKVPMDTVGRPVQHVSSFKQVTGEAQYLDDIPPYRDELHFVPVMSKRAHARIVSVDPSVALAAPGVVDYVDVKDVPGENLAYTGQEVFANGKVTCVGQFIGGIIADTQEHAMKASRLVKVEYEDITPKIITIEDAIEHDSYYDVSKVVKGDVEKGFNDSDHVLEGEMRVGGQEHFYLETQACIALPRNGENEMEIFSSSQDPSALQSMAASCLGVHRNKVFVRTKRVGGGFGGKETKFGLVSSPVAVAAKKLGKPIRCMLTRQEDMLITGGRHPYLGRYKIGFNKDGQIVAVQLKLYSNAGDTADLSIGVMVKAIFQADNAYNVTHMEVMGYTCRANVASNTAFRGFGAPQSTVIAEDWICKVADYLNMDAEKIRSINLYENGDTYLYGAIAHDITLRRCWDECLERSGFEQARKEVEEFNKNNRWKKRGISCTPTKFSVAFGLKQLNQGSALVLVYTDGTVLVSHGGTEMGQGLHTKIIQIASKVLEIPIDLIHISETSTACNANCPATAASAGSDIFGMAVKIACEKIMKRLKPLRAANSDLTWKELTQKAWVERISLSATGYYRIPDIDRVWDNKTGSFVGELSSYKTCGAAVTEVEIDVLTGHHAVKKTEIVMDLGNSLNPAVDIGQIEGAFAQGYGLLTLEEPLHSSSGQMWNVGPGAYKIPGFADTPKIFNVHLLKDSPNEKAIYSSRAVGEPPLLLATSAFCALREAIKSARSDAGLTGPFRLDSPATAERIRMTCEDKFTKLAELRPELKNGFTPWSVRT